MHRIMYKEFVCLCARRSVDQRSETTEIFKRHRRLTLAARELHGVQDLLNRRPVHEVQR